MKKIISYCFEKWFRPVFFLGFTFLLLGISIIIGKAKLVDYSSILLLIGFFILVISFVYQLIRKKWLNALLTASIFAIGLVAFFFSSVYLFYFYQSNDGYVDYLEIPNNITLEKPIGNDSITRPQSIYTGEKKNLDFQLYNSFQPGLYEYDIWLNKIDSGTVYIKAFEITKNDRLSEENLNERTSLHVHNKTDTLKIFGTKNNFTIYEGDWGKPYAARFEIWYKPDNGKERKLTQKNYIIEGWQR